MRRVRRRRPALSAPATNRSRRRPSTRATDDAGQWRVRVVPNKFPAVPLDEPAAAGAHEVIIESARHVDRMSALTVAEFADVLTAYRERLAHWRDSGRFDYGLVFKNLGAAAGASLAHVHSQLIALPAAAAARGRRTRAGPAALRPKHGDCPYCRSDRERAANRRARRARARRADRLLPLREPAAGRSLADADGARTLVRTAHATAVERRPHSPRSCTRSWCGSKRFCRGRRTICSSAPRPGRMTRPRCGHWRIEILPRVNPLAGFELATQMYINPICSDPRRTTIKVELAFLYCQRTRTVTIP